MNDLIGFLTQFHKDAPPFISENEDGSYSLVGISDKAATANFDYGELGSCKLTAKNHSDTLLSLMNFIILVDAMSDSEELSFEDEEVTVFLEFQFSEVLSKYFCENVAYSHDLAIAFLKDNPQLVNEALYNVTKDKEQITNVDYQSIVDGLDGTQFQDPYINIAYEIAKEFKLRPFEVIENWSTAELIVTFAKLANDRSLDSFLNWKYSQKNAPKPKPPRKQAFYFEEIGEEEENKKALLD
ncbi:hypothetical protein [Enterococcus pallens]|uniref:Uncharacterized protein n=1 Tax=Enterococcus pallens ATCC BAA-351 TaxID=1158607 RepID=R2S1J4_9ENTE|nr:hypothetical protein [Enterococcus pallens]EOH86701.1 hypothetical protein UAU_05146 [Enterococcus pallens ATCC BAA-351]EOU18497.1 hypothetical protein I588_03491 [Enterococcus pallens ATCC BAA-351]OJG76516.1 hypothetical protein RV10_GL003653 [Enterococcus pallens]